MDQLVCTADELQVVDVNKLEANTPRLLRQHGTPSFSNRRRTPYLVCDLGAKEPTSAARADGPGVHVLWVRPHQVTEGALVRDLLVAFDGADLVQSLDVR